MRTDNITKLSPDPKYMPRPGYYQNWKNSYDKEHYKKWKSDDIEWINKGPGVQIEMSYYVYLYVDGDVDFLKPDQESLYFRLERLEKAMSKLVSNGYGEIECQLVKNN